ncbi:hypothetical protein GCM10008908_39450 [Clostridium subterminale]|uniref:Uncharacterized protein n=1 Tax=Clostridium subterminale TaxID=1550 RepID=A0ABP3WC94_CLOSU
MNNESKEWFKVIEIADLLGLSKVSIYNKIKTLDNDVLQPLQRKEKGITYYNYKIIDMIGDNPIDKAKDEVVADIVSDKYIDIYISELKEEIKFLKEQIRSKDDLILKQVKLVENEQILKREEQKAIQMLEESKAKEVDEKLTVWREQHYSSEIKEIKESPLQRLKRFFKSK